MSTHPKYQVFRLGVNGWIWEGMRLETAKTKADSLIARYGASAWVVDGANGNVSYLVSVPR